MEALQTTAPESSLAADQQFQLVANSLAKLLETARRELERDREVAKASLVTASHILQAAVWRLGRSFACGLTLTAICTASFTSGISVRSLVEARRTFPENLNWPSA